MPAPARASGRTCFSSGKGQAEKDVKPKRTSRRRNEPGSKEEDFVPWVPADTEGPKDLEEEEREERMTGLLDCYAARKRRRQVISSYESDTAPVQTTGPSLPAVDGKPTAE